MPEAPPKRVLLLGGEGMGRGDDRLGLTLLENFLKTLVGNPLRPETVVCWNAGVKLLTADSRVVQLFQDLHGLGVEILACKTCVNFYNLQGKLGAGEVVSMPVIVDTLLHHDVLTV